MNAPELTIIIPAHNEAGNLSPLLREVRAAFAKESYEVLIVDDQSADATVDEVHAAADEDGEGRLRLIRHGQRAGKSRALHTGFHAARGRWIATIDGDGQNDPQDLARIWRIARASDERVLIAGVRRKRNDGAVKWLTSRVANFVRKRMLRDNCRDTACGVKMMPTAFAQRLPYFDNMHRFFPALARRAGLEVAEEIIDDRPRQHGVSKYGFFDRASVALLDLIGVYWLIRRYSDPGALAEERPGARGAAEESRSNN